MSSNNASNGPRSAPPTSSRELAQTAAMYDTECCEYCALPHIFALPTEARVIAFLKYLEDKRLGLAAGHPPSGGQQQNSQNTSSAQWRIWGSYSMTIWGKSWTWFGGGLIWGKFVILEGFELGDGGWCRSLAEGTGCRFELWVWDVDLKTGASQQDFFETSNWHRASRMGWGLVLDIDWENSNFSPFPPCSQVQWAFEVISSTS